MNGTIYMPVGEVCSSISDTYREKKNMVTLINTSDVLEGRLLNHERVPNSNLKGQFKKTFQRDDILYSEIRPQNRRFAYVDFSPIDYIASTKLMVIRAKKDVVSPKYLYYFLKNSSTVAELQLLAETRSGTFPQITFSEVANLTIPVPSLAVQEVIVQTMQCLEDKITCNEQINDNLQQQLFSLYENMATASPCLKEYTLSNLCDFQEGYVNPPQTHPEYFDGEVKWLRAVDINESFIIETSRTLTKAGFESAKKSALLFEPNTIAISKSGTIGRLGIIADYMCGNRAVINIAPHDTNMLAFIYCFLKSKQREFPDMAVGSVQKNLYVSLLEPLSVSIPDNESLTAFNAVGASILGMIHNNCVENTDLANLRDTILPKLMSGEIDVSSVLL